MENLTVVMALRGLAGVGAVGVAVWLLSLFGESNDFYKSLSPLAKRVVMFGLSAIIALTAYAAVTYVPDTFWVGIEQPFVMISLIVGAIFGNQLVHRVGTKLTGLDRKMKLIERNGMIVPDPVISETAFDGSLTQRRPSIINTAAGPQQIHNETNQRKSE